jgi:hypothetical protein
MNDLPLTEVRHFVAAANAARWQSAASGRAIESEDCDAEQQLDALFRTSHTLAVYGTLAPGRANLYATTETNLSASAL